MKKRPLRPTPAKRPAGKVAIDACAYCHLKDGPHTGHLFLTLATMLGIALRPVPA